MDAFFFKRAAHTFTFAFDFLMGAGDDIFRVLFGPLFNLSRQFIAYFTGLLNDDIAFVLGFIKDLGLGNFKRGQFSLDLVRIFEGFADIVFPLF